MVKTSKSRRVDHKPDRTARTWKARTLLLVHGQTTTRKPLKSTNHAKIGWTLDVAADR
jgi:hypothetical protein